MTDIAALFAKDPRSHTDADIDAIIKTLRENRSKFVMEGDKQAGNTKKITEAQKKLQGVDLKLDL